MPCRDSCGNRDTLNALSFENIVARRLLQFGCAFGTFRSSNWVSLQRSVVAYDETHMGQTARD